MVISDELIQYVSTLSRLDLDDEEKAKIKSEMEKLLDYMDVLNSLDTDDVEPLSHVLKDTNVFRDDVVVPSMDRDEILKNGPLVEDGAFCVPKTVE